MHDLGHLHILSWKVGSCLLSKLMSKWMREYLECNFFPLCFVGISGDLCYCVVYFEMHKLIVLKRRCWIVYLTINLECDVECMSIFVVSLLLTAKSKMKSSFWLHSTNLSRWKEPLMDKVGMLGISRIIKQAELRLESLVFEELATYEGATITDIKKECEQSVGDSKDSTMLLGCPFFCK